MCSIFTSAIFSSMNEAITYRGRMISSEDVTFIRKLIMQYPQASRRRLSQLLCEAWDWRQCNGALCDMVCRSMMLMLYRAGHIELPAKKFSPPNPLGKRCKPETDFLLDETVKIGPLSELQPLEIRQVRRTGDEAIFNGLIEKHHYLGYIQPVGAHLKYIVYFEGWPIACICWGAAPWHIASRDKYIGWPPQVRRKNLRFIACNTRFLILPWVKVPHLASHILGRMVKRVQADWLEIYNHRLYYLETFVDTERFKGTCYKAANWKLLGQTTGRWREDKKNEQGRHIKDVLGYPLTKDFRERMRTVENE